jgi:3-hydroxy acid dehydrogenase / malonic semialdehyde reductase
MKIIISGSSSGIGRAITLKLLELGYEVIGLARNHQKFNPQNSRYLTYTVDFSDIRNAEQILKQIHSEHPRVDAIISNAGYGRFGALEQFSTAQISDLVNVNFLGQVLLVKTWLSAFKRQKQGRIILMGSESALSGAKQGSIYCATKFAVRGFAQSLRAECRSAGISVTLVNPGLVSTPFFDNLHFIPGSDPLNAMQPEDIASAIAYLLQSENRFVVEEINMQPSRPAILTQP